MAKREYNFARGSSSASDCIGCGQCEGACPQHLPIIDLLAEVAEVLEGLSRKNPPLQARMQRCFEPGIHTDQVRYKVLFTVGEKI